MRIYWANAMFSEADRAFNSMCADSLRTAGHQVILPQETNVNRLDSPSAEDIFRSDTCAIMESQVLVACIDQETIDCGVACEIGIAFACGIPVVGLCTDMRQYRKGEGRIYKNPYVVGTIKASGRIVLSINELLQVLREYSAYHDTPTSYSREDSYRQHYDRVAPEYRHMIEALESWYDPPWSVKDAVEQSFTSIEPRRVLDFGCGSGDLGTYVLCRYPNAFYLGYDQSDAMIQSAVSYCREISGCIFTSSWQEVRKHAQEEPFDAVLLSFVLHDLSDPLRVIKMIAQCLRPGGVILIIDLSKWDLPTLTKLMRRKLARPCRVVDKRLDAPQLMTFARATGLSLIDCNITSPLVRFPSSSALNDYLEKFGIYSGMDLPLGLDNIGSAVTQQLMRQVLAEQSYPFVDCRAFISCLLKKERRIGKVGSI
jgi:ubiquinone/menaquinone biosynthesis C-methylase UbiE